MLQPYIVAHRGDTQIAPENTLPAFEAAIANGADAVELDVHLTRDHQLVVHHDYYLGRTNNGKGYIGDYTLAELRSLDAGSWYNLRFAGEKIPTLADVLTLGEGKTRFEIELKGTSLQFLKQLIDEIALYGLLDDVELTTPHVPLLLHIKQYNSKLRTGLFFYPFPEWMEPALGQQHILGWMALADAQVAHLHVSLITSDFVPRLQASGLCAYGSNLSTPEQIRHGLSSGIDQFSTDELSLAIEMRTIHTNVARQ